MGFARSRAYPSGKKDAHGQPVPLGTRIGVDPDEAKVIQTIFELAAEGVGLTTIVERLRERHPGNRWQALVEDQSRGFSRTSVTSAPDWGQQSVEHDTGTGRKIMRDNPRSEWRIEERPELRIISDELWNRVQQTRSEIRKAVAPKQNLGRGKDARFR